MFPLRVLPPAFAGGGLAAALFTGFAGGLPASPELCTLEGDLEEVAVPCSCVDEPDLDRRVAGYVDGAEVVMQVLVSSVDTLGGPLPDVPPPALAAQEARHPVVATLTVERIWKGESTDTATLVMTDAWLPMSSCAVIPAPGERYLLFASPGSRTEHLRTHGCSGTTTLARAAEEGLLERLPAAP
jgi:hypothetical protein